MDFKSEFALSGIIFGYTMRTRSQNKVRYYLQYLHWTTHPDHSSYLYPLRRRMSFIDQKCFGTKTLITSSLKTASFTSTLSRKTFLKLVVFELTLLPMTCLSFLIHLLFFYFFIALDPKVCFWLPWAPL